MLVDCGNVVESRIHERMLMPNHTSEAILMDVAKETSDLYPDVIAAGGLSNALQSALEKIGSTLVVKELDKRYNFVAYARVEGRACFSQVYIAADERCFLFDFWKKGVCLAHGRTPDLGVMSQAIDRWISGNVGTANLIAAFPFVKAEDAAPAFESENEVEHRWQSYLKGNTHPVLLELVKYAATRPELRMLFPYTSMYTLCFSRCTGYPYSGDLPHIEPVEDGKYQVSDRSLRVLGIGNIEEVVSIMIENLPAGCGPAVPGTAEDLAQHPS